VPAIIYLDYIQLAIIHAICSDCELAHFLGLVLFALFIITFSDRTERRKQSKNEHSPATSAFHGTKIA